MTVLPPTNQRRAFIVGAYLPNGGTFMAYHLGRILEQEFGYHAIAVAVRDETADHGVHDYDLRMPLVSLVDMERQISAADVLIVNPSFSPHQFGWRLPGLKICYVQHFNTFALLDRNFDHYVAVSSFVAEFLRVVYAIDTRVIAPFIRLDALPPAQPWQQRPAHRVLPYRKGTPEVWELSYRRLREIVHARAPHVEFAEPLDGAGMPQQDLFRRLAAVRYALVLSAAEGFGLVPLEAMALGTVVCGFDGFGGRDYMRTMRNCAVAPYPQIERIADLLIALIDNPAQGLAISQAGPATATAYDYAAFRRAWVAEFRDVLIRAGRI